MFTYPIGLLNPKVGGIPINGLTHEWLFSGNADDTAGLNDGTVHDATLTTDRHSVADSAYDFDGTTAYIDFGDIDFETLGKEASFSFWAKFDTLVGDMVLLHSNLLPATNVFYIAKQDGGNFRLFIGGDYDNTAISVSSDIVNWAHFVLNLKINISDILEIELFKDGVSIFTDTTAVVSPLSVFNISDSLFMGRLVSSPIRFLNGKLDDIRVYNRVLSLSEITALYNE